MKKKLQFVLAIILTILYASPSLAQKTLIHYWNFNTLAGPYIHPNIPHIMPDYPAGDTAYLEYYLLPGTSATWAISGPDANNASGAQIDNVAGDTTNARNGAVAGTGIRFRNPTDSAELHWYIPSTGFSNLIVKFATQTSSIASGDSVQDYSYSTDGGKTWGNTGMTVNGAAGHSLDLTQGGNANSIYLSFAPVTVTFGSNTAVNNNPNLIFRIVFVGNTHPGFPVSGSTQVSGNNRFDNFTVDGTPMAVVPKLIHYWNFNTLAGPYIHPNIPHIMPDYPAGDTAYLEYYLLPGTSATWAISGPDANNASGAQIDNVAGDTTNARNGAVAGTGIRFRNPTDSAELHWHIPSTGFSNLIVKFATQTSSIASGDSVQDYSYSTDGGKTWGNTGMTVNGAAGHSLDLTQGGNANSIYLSFAPVTVTFGSNTAVNNNPNLIFRIVFVGNTHPGFPVSGSTQVSGNNRFDNFTVDGVGGSIGPPPATITVHSPGNQILVSGRHATVAFDTINNVGATKTIEYSTDGGTTWNSAGTTTTNSYDWVVPAAPTTNGMVRVKGSDGKSVGLSSQFIIAVITSANKIIHYWDFNTVSGAYNIPIPPFAADFSTNPSTPGSLAYTLTAGTPNTYKGYIDNVAGSTNNAQFGAPAGQGLRVRNPTDKVELWFKIPTTGYKNISFSYVIEESSNISPLTRHFDYSIDGGTTWSTTGLSILTESFLDSNSFGSALINFASGSPAENNANLVFRIKMTGGLDTGTSGNNRYDNVTVMGDPTTGGVKENSSTQWNCNLYPNPANNAIMLSTPSEGIKEISIFDLTGRVMLTSKSSDKNISIGISQLTPGMYTIHVLDLSSNNQSTIKFVKE